MAITATAPAAPLLRAGETCWRIAHADRVRFLVDGEAYFRAVADALEGARRIVWLLGWDFHSAVRLRRGEAPDRPGELVPLLEQLVRERPSLHVRVLAWDFAMLYVLEREFVPLLQFGARTHRRIHFAMDSAHPPTASQHQKLVVVDDAVAFVGGFDLTTHRWDTREHRPEDDRRVTPAGDPYGPFHDVQVAVDGAAARALAELARERWRNATGRRAREKAKAGDPWPPGLEPHLRDVEVGISRTAPSFRGRPEVREVEALYRESIAAARRWIYLENQYLTAPKIVSWLAERLREPDGPEVVIVGPRENSGWLEENTMGALRDRAVRELRAADPGDRLRVLYPSLPGDGMLNVHSKVMIVDDAFVRVGSSNLSNRSLGLDAECDLSLEAGGRDDVRSAVAALRDDLLAEHLGTTPAAVAAALERTGSLVRTVESLGGGERALRPLELDADDRTAAAVETLGAVDPEHPAPLAELVARFAEGRRTGPARPRSARIGAIAAVLVVLFLFWQMAPVEAWLASQRVTSALSLLREPWYGPLLAGAFFVLACLAFVPVSALTVATGLTLGPALGVAVAWLGAVAAAGLGHRAGRVLWREAVRRLAGARLNDLSERLARRGIVSTALVRIVPIAPFMVVNLVAGASHVGARDFVLGTAIGLLPGTIVLVLAASSARALLTTPIGPAWIWSALAVLALVGAALGLRWLGSRRASMRDARP